MLHAIDMRSESNTMTFLGSCELLDLCLLKIKHFPVTAGFETHRAIHLAALSAFHIPRGACQDSSRIALKSYSHRAAKQPKSELNQRTKPKTSRSMKTKATVTAI